MYQVVLLVDQSLERQQAWDQACTAHGAAFYSAASRGTCTYFFANLHKHTFTPLVRTGHVCVITCSVPVSCCHRRLLFNCGMIIRPAHHCSHADVVLSRNSSVICVRCHRQLSVTTGVCLNDAMLDTVCQIARLQQLCSNGCDFVETTNSGTLDSF